MYTAKVLRKEEDNGVVKVFVTFTDGVNTQTEWCIPQDRAGFDHWVKSRLAVFNTGEQLKADLADGADIDVSDPVPPANTRTQAEKDRNTWLEKYAKWVRIKTTMIDTGVLTGNEAPVVAFLADVKAGFKPAYINYI